MKKDLKIISAVNYYDKIAEKYDVQLNTKSDLRVRTIVQNYVTKLDDIKTVLDFGAGTGQDLEWQLKSNYEVTFYEPSEEMAHVANQRFNFSRQKHLNVYTGKAATYKTLLSNGLTYDLMFSNFAAINSIENLEQLFHVVFKTLRDHGHFVFLVYKHGTLKRKLRSLFLPYQNNKSIIYNAKKSSGMIAYMHTHKQILRAAKLSGFTLYSKQNIDTDKFNLYHFVKK